jgi:hypothetical protein
MVMQLVHDGEDDPHLTFLSDKMWFNSHGHVCCQNNRYGFLLIHG